MTATDILQIVAVLLSPLFAVQATRFLDDTRERQAKRLNIYRILMTTRANMNAAHVEALNSIDIEFNRPRDKDVLAAWRSYLDHVSNGPADAAWGLKRDDLLAALLMSMGKSLGYNFDEVHIKRSIYIPKLITDDSDYQKSARSALIRVLDGKSAIKVNILEPDEMHDEQPRQ